MRLTCPNCGAQYEVPDDVIPEEGRDVQCSNCGDTWFQQAAGFAQAAEGNDADAQEDAPQTQSTAPKASPPVATRPEASPPEDAVLPAEAENVEITSERFPDPAAAEGAATTRPQADTVPQADTAPQEAEGVAPAPLRQSRLQEQAQETVHETAHPIEAKTDSEKEAEDATPHQRRLDPALGDILREEAEREASLRASDHGQVQGLETQPNLGLDDLPDNEEARRSRQASDRMARIRGEDPRRLAAEASGLKRGVLPDIEEINSTLRAADAPPSPPMGDMVPPPRKSGFTRGFALEILAILALVMIYSNAPQIAELLPQADPYLSSYVTWVDQMRLWLDTQVSELQKPQF